MRGVGKVERPHALRTLLSARLEMHFAVASSEEIIHLYV